MIFKHAQWIQNYTKNPGFRLKLLSNTSHTTMQIDEKRIWRQIGDKIDHYISCRRNFLIPWKIALRVRSAVTQLFSWYVHSFGKLYTQQSIRFNLSQQSSWEVQLRITQHKIKTNNKTYHKRQTCTLILTQITYIKKHQLHQSLILHYIITLES